MKLGVSDTGKRSFEYYVAWLHRAAPDLEVAKLSYLEGNLSDLEQCRGLVLTGGGDVDPGFYGGIGAEVHFRDVHPERDEFEFDVIRRAISMDIPILAICRGMQVFNIALGGSLLPDLESEGFRNHRKSEHEYPSHGIHVEQATFLREIVRSRDGRVTTNHHQAVDRVGRSLRVSAKASDGVIEGLEWANPAGKPFLQLLQWHPERMEDYHSPFSGGVLERFIQEARTEK